MDFGFPQILDPDLLKMYITQGKANALAQTVLPFLITLRALRN